MTYQELEERIRNTMLLFSEGMSNSAADIIEEETEGQQWILRNTVLPVKIEDCTESTLIDLGFKLGEVLADDPLFRYGSIPEGWTMEPDGSFHTTLIDEQGNHRGYISYKAAPNDRWAFMTVK